MKPILASSAVHAAARASWLDTRGCSVTPATRHTGMSKQEDYTTSGIVLLGAGAPAPAAALLVVADADEDADCCGTGEAR